MNNELPEPPDVPELVKDWLSFLRSRATPEGARVAGIFEAAGFAYLWIREVTRLTTCPIDSKRYVYAKSYTALRNDAQTNANAWSEKCRGLIESE